MADCRLTNLSEMISEQEQDTQEILSVLQNLVLASVKAWGFERELEDLLGADISYDDYAGMCTMIQEPRLKEVMEKITAAHVDQIREAVTLRGEAK